MTNNGNKRRDPNSMTREQLIDRVEELEQMLGCDVSFESHIRARLGGQPRTATLLGMLLSRDFVSKETAMLTIYGGDCETMPNDKIVNTYIHKVRTMIKPHGCDVECVWGEGYKMDIEHRKKIGALLATK